MKIFKCFATLLAISLTALGFQSCGSDEGPDEPQKVTSLTQRQCSISEGATVDAATTTVVTLTFNNTVRVAPSASVTLNGAKLSPAVSPRTAMEVDIPLTLQDGIDYELQIAAGSFVATTDANCQSAAFTLHFKTAKVVKPGDNLPDNEAMRMTRELGWGWNLGNHFDTSSGEDNLKPQWGWWDGVEPTEALYKSLAAMGAKSVRIPVTWGNYQSTTDGQWTIEENYMKDVEKNVKWALNAGLYVILNTHHDEYWQNIIAAVGNSATNTATEDRIQKTWTQIAKRFESCNDHLIFETFNEIHDESWGWKQGYNYKPVFSLMNEWNKVAVDAIRATGGNNASRWIGIPGFCANPVFTFDNLTIPNSDKKIMIAVHSYDPYNFCTEGSVQRWGHVFRGNDSDEKQVDDLFAKLRDKYIMNNIPCYMGEYGAVTRKSSADEKYRTYYLEYFCRAAYYHGIPVMLWDNNSNSSSGEAFYFINHKDGSFNNESLVRLMIKAATSTDASYTLKQIYNNAK